MSSVRIEKAVRAFPARIIKLDATQRIAVGVVLAPTTPDTADSQADWYLPADVEQAAYSFMKNVAGGTGWGDLMHDEVSKIGYPVESYIAPVDFVLGDGEQAQLVRAGSWVVAMKYEDEAIWKRIVDGELAAFSVGGRGVRIYDGPAA